MLAVFLTSAIAIGVVFLYGCVGEIITEKAGHLNLGIPGIMCIGTAGGCWGVSLYMKFNFVNPNGLLVMLTLLFFTFLFSALAGCIYAVLTVILKGNQNVTGLALTIFGNGFTQYFMDNFVDRTYFSKASVLIKSALPFADKLGWFGQIFLSHGFLVYFAVAIAIAAAVILKRTRIGLNLRAVGENPATADAVGINVTLYKFVAIIIGSSIAGLGGSFYIMDYISGSWQNAATIEAMGWLAIALVIFTLWKPDLSILGSVLFGALFIASNYITGVSFSQMKLLKLLPYVVTVIVLVVTSVMDSKDNQPPASLGVNYFREER